MRKIVEYTFEVLVALGPLMWWIATLALFSMGVAGLVGSWESNFAAGGW